MHLCQNMLFIYFFKIILFFYVIVEDLNILIDTIDILTGNRKIIRDKTIKKPFVMGPKYRESKTLYFEKVKLDIADLN